MSTQAPETIDEAKLRIEELETGLSRLRHDVRGMLTPAMLVSDSLRTHSDQKVGRAGELVIRVIDQIADRLRRTRELVPPRLTSDEQSRDLAGR